MPLPKPHKGEAQDAFMARCMHEAYGSDAPEDRTQEQAVAMCFQAWRDKDKKQMADAEVQRIIKLWCKIIEKQVDIPEPEDGESKEDFMSRCVDELDQLEDPDAEDACEMAWEDYAEGEDRAAAKNGLVIKQHMTEADLGEEYIMS